MKKIFSVIALVIAAPAFAADAVSTSGSSSIAGASNAGNSQNITFTSPEETTQNINANTVGVVTSTATVDETSNQTITSNGTQRVIQEISGSQKLKNTPSVSGPPLVTSNDTCMGSTSGSLNIAGLGIGGGSTWTDTNCKRLKNARELWNMGMRAASMAMLCNDEEVRGALEVTGYECPAAKKEEAVTPQVRKTTSRRPR